VQGYAVVNQSEGDMLIVSDPELSWAVTKALFIVVSGFVAVMCLVWIAFKDVVLRQTSERETTVHGQRGRLARQMQANLTGEIPQSSNFIRSSHSF
jgi:hypothetical protein